MAYDPKFLVSPDLLRRVEAIAALRERIQGAAVELSWIPALQKDNRSRTAHASTAIEGNPLTLAQVRALADGSDLSGPDERSKREITNYFAGLRFIEKHAKTGKLGHDDVFRLHRILAGGVMEQGEAGRYRTIAVQVGRFVPPAAEDVSGLMFELIDWWNRKAEGLSPVLSSAIVHYRFEAIHPFADGNGRTGRALSLWELYRRGFDTHRLFSVDEYYWEDRARYYAALDAARKKGEDLTEWLEYCAEGLQWTLDRVWLRVNRYRVSSSKKIVLRPRQERLLELLRDNGGMAPAEIWSSLKVSRQGAMDLLRPLLEAELVEKVGGKKTGRYVLRK